MVKIMQKIKNFLTISRANIQVATIPHALLGIFMAAYTLDDIMKVDNLVYVMLYLLLITLACNINCLYDIDVDKYYKKSLYDATVSLGVKNVKILIVIEGIIAIFIIFYLYTRGHVITAALSFIGILLAAIYSSPPPRIKARGFLSAFPTFVGLYMLPLLGGWYMLRDSLKISFILFIAGYALMNEGFTLVNTCEDYAEDKREGIKTWAHIFGIKNTLRIAFVFSSGGILCIFPVMNNIFYGSLNMGKAISLAFVGVFLFALINSMRDVWKAIDSHDLQKSSKKYARKMPLWFISTRYPLLLAILFII